MALSKLARTGLFLTAAWASSAQAIPVRFQFNPPGADARITPLFFFQFCKKTAPDPWDAKCGRWDVVKPEMELKGGDYCVFAQWGPKTEYRGAANFTVGEKPRPFVIQPRGINKTFCT